MDRESLDLEIKLSSVDPEAGTIEGIASPFNGSPDRVGDVVAPGAFSRSLADHKARGTMPAMLWSHDPAAPIGAWTDIAETAGGLKVRGKLALGTAKADEAHRLVKAGAALGLSIGFKTVKASRLSGGYRRLEEVDLVEVSIVAVPAAPAARITSVKSFPAAAAATQTESKTMAEQTAAADTATDKTTDDRVSALETSVADIDKRLKTVEGTIGNTAKGVERIETILRRPGAGATTEAKGDTAPEVKAFENYLRAGREGMDFTEVKTLRVSDDESGGFLVPPEFVAEIDKTVVLFSPIRQLATVRQTSRGTVQIPKRIGLPAATWVEEMDDRDGTGSEARYGRSDYAVKELTTFCDVSLSLLEDSAVDIAAEIAADLGEAFGLSEGQAFVNGTGTTRPLGFMADTTIPELLSGDANLITADSLIDLFHAVPTPYRTNAVWTMNSAVLGAVRKLKDGNGQYLALVQGINGTPATTILGRPVVEVPDMPNVAAGAVPIVFGDFTQGYRVFDRIGVSILRDDFTQRTKGKVRFHARRRVAGGVRKAEALRKLKVGA
ncbi:MAG TPA: phage major capsid protein [Azospirillaceae bacterium]|nr:phage major capsid protein [Azospirillaceae bacterium]